MHRREEVRSNLARRYGGYANTYRDALVKFYGEARGRKTRYAQAYEVCEYGRQPSRDELKRLRAENTELRRANEILKAASAIFAAGLDRPRTR